MTKDDLAGPLQPEQIDTLPDLTRAFDKLRRQAARPGQTRMSIRDVATRMGKAPSTVDPYLRGQRLCPADVYEHLLRALGVPAHLFRPWLDAWERIADGHQARPPLQAGTPTTITHPEPVSRRGASSIVDHTQTFTYDLTALDSGASAAIGLITGYLRRVTGIDIWVNSENTHMEMARVNDYSISAVIRFEGAIRDDTGEIVEDLIADELAKRAIGRRPAAPATVVTTGPGMLAHRNGVRYIIHVAAVHGEPGRGYRQVIDVGRCLSNAFTEAETLAEHDPSVTTILFPLLGVGSGGGAIEPTFRALLGAAIHHLTARNRHVATAYFLAHTDEELAVCLAVLDEHPHLSKRPPITAERTGPRQPSATGPS